MVCGLAGRLAELPVERAGIDQVHDVPPRPEHDAGTAGEDAGAEAGTRDQGDHGDDDERPRGLR